MLKRLFTTVPCSWLTDANCENMKPLLKPSFLIDRGFFYLGAYRFWYGHLIPDLLFDKAGEKCGNTITFTWDRLCNLFKTLATPALIKTSTGTSWNLRCIHFLLKEGNRVTIGI